MWAKKINRVTILSHHDRFRHRRRVTSSMKNTVATTGLPQSPLPTRNLWLSCRLVRSNSHYFLRNHTISTMWFLLHGGHHNATQRRWEYCQSKLFFIMFYPPWNHLQIFIMEYFYSFISGSSCVVFHQFGGELSSAEQWIKEITSECSSSSDNKQLNNQPG